MKRFVLLFISLIICTLGLGYLHLFPLINILFILIGVYSYQKFPEFNIFLFIVFLSSNGMISTNYNLFGFFHVSRIINLFAIITMYKCFPIAKIELNSFQKTAIYLTIFAFITIMIIQFKIYEFNLARSIIDFGTFFKRLIKYILLTVALIMLVKRYNFDAIKEAIIIGIGVSIIFLSSSIFFADFLSSIGFDCKIGVANDDFLTEARKSGFFMNEGDENTSAGIIALSTGLLISLTRKYKSLIPINLIIAFAIIGVLGTISRAGAISLVGIFAIFIITESKTSTSNIKLFLAIIILGIILLYGGYMQNILARFSIIENTMSDNNDSRYGGWVFYLNYIFSDISIVLWGATENLYSSTNSGSYFRVAHNFYISNIYYSGIFSLLIILRLLILNIKNYIIHVEKSHLILYTLFPFLMVTNTTSDLGIFFPFIISIPFATEFILQEEEIIEETYA